MTKKHSLTSDDALPKGMGAPATRALNAAGITSLSQVTSVTVGELSALHGFGPKALSVLVGALEERGLSLARAGAGANANANAKSKGLRP